jgi:hypothetical protein
MNIDERHLLNARIGELLHVALVEIRYFTFPPLPDTPDRREEINDLADLLHNLPRYVVGHDEYAIDSPEQLREAVLKHVRRFYPDIDPAEHRYVQLLDMDDETFLQRYRDNLWGASVRLASARS